MRTIEQNIDGNEDSLYVGGQHDIIPVILLLL